MVWCYRAADYRHFASHRYLTQQIAGMLANITRQYRIPILGTPYNMVLNIIYRVPASFIFVNFAHLRSPTESIYTLKVYQLKAGGIKPGVGNLKYFLRKIPPTFS